LRGSNMAESFVLELGDGVRPPRSPAAHVRALLIGALGKLPATAAALQAKTNQKSSELT
jgi:hypothetical protein